MKPFFNKDEYRTIPEARLPISLKTRNNKENKLARIMDEGSKESASTRFTNMQSKSINSVKMAGGLQQSQASQSIPGSIGLPSLQLTSQTVFNSTRQMKQPSPTMQMSIQSSQESLKLARNISPQPQPSDYKQSIRSLYEDEEPYNFDEFDEDDDGKQLYAVESINQYIFQSDSVVRKWLSTHGKKRFINFTDGELAKLRKYFQELDEDGSGSIGIEELEKPLISLGLCNSREDVKGILAEVDEDGSGQIEFKEFLKIIKKAQYEKQKRAKTQREQINNLHKKSININKKSTTSPVPQPAVPKAPKTERKLNLVLPALSGRSTVATLSNRSSAAAMKTIQAAQSTRSQVQDKESIFSFFKNLTSGKLQQSENPNIPFQLFISNFRRRRILDTIMQSSVSNTLSNPESKQVLNPVLQQKSQEEASNQHLHTEEEEDPGIFNHILRSKQQK